ncbi:MAG: phenylacetate--CoA ligase family protein [Candidatus Puniceispirillales bacterium WSBS_2018_MAG_OTU23]
MTTPYHFDDLETRTADARGSDIARQLPQIIAHAKANSSGYGKILTDIDPSVIIDASALSALPITRKAQMLATGGSTPLREFVTRDFSSIDNIYQSPGPIYEIGMDSHDWWRFGRFLSALGVGVGDLVANTFSYHFTPAGKMFENAAKAVGASVIPAGTGQTELQATAMADLGVTTYAGTPDYLKTILEKGDEMGLDLAAVKTAAVSGGPLFPALRDEYTNRGITCRQCYGTADLGHIAYESSAMDGMIVDEGVIVEIVTPGTGMPVPEGDVGEVVVTSFNQDFPMIRFATGDLSAVLPGQSACGRTNMRIVGWRGRADQSTKVKGMFVRPEQVAALVERHDSIIKARVTVTHDGSSDQMLVQFEATGVLVANIEDSIRDVLKLRADVEWCAPRSLPNDGLVIDDKRPID